MVKEADALSAAGYDVRVVASQHVDWVAEWDTELVASKIWKYVPVRWDRSSNKSSFLRIKSGLRQRGFRVTTRFNNRIGAERAYSRLFDELLSKVLTEPADLIIAHNPQALPVAGAAAAKLRCRFAFDSEDFHTGEFLEDQQSSPEARLLSRLEAKYLKQCVFVTTPSEPISDALQRKYQIDRPIAIHNVFPWKDRRELDGQIEDRRGDGLSLYWYSQVIGLDRGLQDVIRAASLLRGTFQLHLRGILRPDVHSELMDLARQFRVAEKIVFHEPVHPSKLLSRTAEHDIGLSLEQPLSENRNLTVANKAFFYLLGGLAVVASTTEGQRNALANMNSAVTLYDPGNYGALALELQRFIDSPELLKQAKSNALRAAETRWNWEVESQRLLTLVEKVLDLEDE